MRFVLGKHAEWSEEFALPTKCFFVDVCVFLTHTDVDGLPAEVEHE